jgi:hypothetical protein
VHGAVGLLGTGSWHLCQAAVETVLRGGVIGPLPDLTGGGCGGDLLYGKRAGGGSTFSTAKRVRRSAEAPPAPSCDLGLCLSPRSPAATGERRPGTPSMSSDESVTTTSSGGEREPVLLSLFL